MPRIPFTPVIEALPKLVPFVGPEAIERDTGRRFLARLGANESVFGPSPKAIAVMREAVETVWRYSDPENHDLRAALAAFHGLDVSNVVIGEGIDGLLGLTCLMYLVPGDTVVTSDGAYPTFNFHVLAHGGRLIKVPMAHDREDLDALLGRVRALKSRILYVSNPNNPMGSWWPAEDISRLIAELPPETLLVLDEAYSDTAPDGALPPIDVTNPQIIRYRTFSKAYGLAGARIGYALGDPDIVAAFDKVRNHYGINRVGQLGALAALQDQPYLAEAVGKIARARDRIGTIARTCGLLALPSATNFVAIDCGGDGAFAKRVLDGVLDQGVFIRKPAVAPLDRCIRVSCGRDDDLDLFARALPLALAEARRNVAAGT
ncbi:MAG TPA: pyridoxal phosphate-dependent aminotransferase [Hyphomicrobium sp.]|nr:pyridoxal phosphate-dependent aminotransferase [Hyphomicrobium sp.]